MTLTEIRPSQLRDKNGLYSEMEAARQWGLKPRAWYECDRGERAMMIAHSIMRARIDEALSSGDK